MNHPSATVTGLIQRIRNGDEAAKNSLFWVVYGELHQVARALRFRQSPNHALLSGEVVNEAYFKLMAKDQKALKVSRAYFFAAAARAMRQVLCDYYKKTSLPKTKRPLEVVPDRDPYDGERLQALDRALDELAKYDSLLAQIVELRLFCGLTIRETAEVLHKGTATVERKFASARAFLRLEIEEYMNRDE